jgi:hypothetical protein
VQKTVKKMEINKKGSQFQNTRNNNKELKKTKNHCFKKKKNQLNELTI